MPVLSHFAASRVGSGLRRHWGRGLLGVLAGLAVTIWAAVTFLLDPWLQRTLEQQVRTASQGRYQLRIGHLRTSLLRQRAEVRRVQLRTVGTDSARRPRLALALGRVLVEDVGLWALVRGREVPIGRLRLDSVAVSLDRLPQADDPRPLHEQLPGAGLRVQYLTVRHLTGRIGPATQPAGRLARADLTVRDLRLSAAGAADSARVGYAASVAGRARGLVAQVPGHTVSLGRLRFATTVRQLVLDSVAIHPTQPINNRRSAALRVSLALPQLVLRGLDAAALGRRRFRADTLGFRRPHLALTLPATPPPPFHELLAPYLRECRLGALVATSGRLRVAGTGLAPAADRVQVRGSGLRVLPYRPPGTSIFYAEAWRLRTGRATATLDAPYYHLSWQQLRADTRARRLELQQVAVVPTRSVVALARGKGHQVAHLTARLPVVRLVGLDFAAAANGHQLRAGTLTMDHPRISTRSDGRFPENPAVSHITPEALGRLPFQFGLDEFRIRGGTITTQYRAPRQAQPGILQISRFAATLRNVSNDPARMRAARPLTGEATGLLQGECWARITLRANVLDPTGRHTVSGTFYAAPLAILNSMTVPTRGIRFRRGSIAQIRFRMQLDQRAARGTMWARYSDLKLQRLNRRNQPGVLHRVQTTLINGLVIRDNNPRRPGQALKSGSMHSGRERHYSVFTLWRQGLVSGLLNSAGVPKPLAKKLSEGG
ncbi:hypothetical protein KLP40_10680 [Hymenobacter sp. NST-14]|uniref:hypothetical protein n=1 Tax=Hymenobacter piscis TaxID=2839984 RepID=UPI001C037B78|nr:hypothetical protein [Hymenobacter piscis]MBT9393627.1 hypothetical protein [Hymenobacter piscis]